MPKCFKLFKERERERERAGKLEGRVGLLMKKFSLFVLV